MKPLRILSLLVLWPFVLWNGLRAETVLSDYQKAVNAYVEAAGKELQAIETQVGAALKEADEAKRAAYRGFFERFEKCQEAYERLKTAKPADFDRLKAQYEQLRKESLQALAAVRAG